MDPTPPTPPPPPPSETPGPVPSPEVAEPVVELVRTNRENLGYVLAFLAVVFLAAGIYFVMKGQRMTPSADAARTEKDKDKAPDPEDPLKPLTLDSTETTQAKRLDYFVAGVACGFGMLLFGVGGAFLLAYPQKPTVGEQRTEARVVLLALGGLLGAFLLLTGALYFYRWSESLVKWLDLGEAKEARWVLIPLLMVLGGGALMFLSIWPARAEERNNTMIRRLVYGSNFGLTMLLVFVVLVIANVIFVMRVPNKLDTTQNNFYTLSPQTRQFLDTLEQPIRAYAIFPETGDPVTEDTKRLLQECQDANPSKFRVTLYSPALNKDDIARLKNEYPLAEMSREGVLLVAGDDAAERKRHTFLRADEFGEEKQGPDGRPVSTFNGEPKLLRELMFLAENKQRPKIYFTQSSGELALAPGGRNRPATRMATALKDYLEKNYFDVQPLTFEVGTPAKVPDDAAVVVVADPTDPLPKDGVEAIRKFMSEPRPDGKKGKLVVLAGMQVAPDGKKPLSTGLEPLLGTFGVRLGDGFLHGAPAPALGEFDRSNGIRVMQAMVTQEGVEARNPVALGFNKIERMPLLDCRPIVTSQGAGHQTVTVLVSRPGRQTWLEPELPPTALDAWQDLDRRIKQIVEAPGDLAQKQKAIGEFLRQKEFSESPRELAVFVSEGGTARVAVFGCGWFVSDDASGRAAGFGRAGQTLWLDLMGSTLDWVRDRPTVAGVTEKQYSDYTLKPGYDSLRMIWVPLGAAFLIVFGLGTGVWVIRRK